LRLPESTTLTRKSAPVARGIGNLSKPNNLIILRRRLLMSQHQHQFDQITDRSLAMAGEGLLNLSLAFDRIATSLEKLTAHFIGLEIRMNPKPEHKEPQYHEPNETR
jgi:hypothetical protein